MWPFSSKPKYKGGTGGGPIKPGRSMPIGDVHKDQVIGRRSTGNHKKSQARHTRKNK